VEAGVVEPPIKDGSSVACGVEFQLLSRVSADGSPGASEPRLSRRSARRPTRSRWSTSCQGLVLRVTMPSERFCLCRDCRTARDSLRRDYEQLADTYASSLRWTPPPHSIAAPPSRRADVVIDQQANLREALKQPQITDHIRTDVTATDGDLARRSLDDLGSVERLPRPVRSRPVIGPGLPELGERQGRRS
jgi:hypothetical protein